MKQQRLGEIKKSANLFNNLDFPRVFFFYLCRKLWDHDVVKHSPEDFEETQQMLMVQKQDGGDHLDYLSYGGRMIHFISREKQFLTSSILVMPFIL